MNKEDFLERFQQATIKARDFARKYIEEYLPDDVKCRLQLNASYDGHPLHKDESVFPQDSLPERSLNLASITVEEAVTVLWREGKTPEWINLSVVSKTACHTVIEVVSCGRFTENEDLLYHVRQGLPPFHILGPTLPWNWRDSKEESFSIFHHANCWTFEELEALKEHSSRPWSLELGGSFFNDNILSTLSRFPELEILELKAIPICGFGLSGCSKMPKLRIIRLRCHPLSNLSLDALPYLPKLEILSLSGLIAPPELAVLETATPALTELSLTFTSTERDLTLPHLDGLIKVSIETDQLRHGIRFPEINKVSEISIHGNHSDAEVLSILEQLPSLTSINLRGTNVTDTICQFLSTNNHLSFVDLVGTKVSDAALELLQNKYPELRILPVPISRRNPHSGEISTR